MLHVYTIFQQAVLSDKYVNKNLCQQSHRLCCKPPAARLEKTTTRDEEVKVLTEKLPLCAEPQAKPQYKCLAVHLTSPVSYSRDNY